MGLSRAWFKVFAANLLCQAAITAHSMTFPSDRQTELPEQGNRWQLQPQREIGITSVATRFAVLRCTVRVRGTPRNFAQPFRMDALRPCGGDELRVAVWSAALFESKRASLATVDRMRSVAHGTNIARIIPLLTPQTFVALHPEQIWMPSC